MSNKIPLTKGINDQWKKCEKRTRVIIILIILFTLFGIPLIMGFFFNQYMTHRVGGFDTIEELMAFYKEIPPENIVDIIYGGNSACICYVNGFDRGHRYAYLKNGKWLSATARINTFIREPFFANEVKIKQTGDYFITIFYVDWRGTVKDLEIQDENHSEFIKTKLSEDRSFDYVAHINPTQQEYTFWLDDSKYSVNLKHF